MRERVTETCGAVTLDSRLARVTRDGQPVRLTSHEFRVLSFLMHNRDRVVPQSELTEHIYAQDADRDSNTVEVFNSPAASQAGCRHHRDLAWPWLSNRIVRLRSLRGRLRVSSLLWTVGLLFVSGPPTPT